MTQPPSDRAERLAIELDEARRRIVALQSTAASGAGSRFTETMAEGYALLDADGVHLDVNSAFCAMVGYTREELIGTGPPHLFWPADAAQANGAALAEVLGGEKATFDLVFQRKNGERFPVMVRPSVVTDEAGDVRFAYATFQDASELRRAQAALAESEQMFRLAFDQAPTGAALTGPDFRFRRVNAAFCRMTRYTSEELLQMGFPDITHPDEVDTDVAGIRRLLAGKVQEYAREKRYIRKDGSVIWGDMVVRPVLDETGRPFVNLAMIADIIERKRAEQATAREHRLAQSYLDVVQVMLVAIAADETIVLANRKTCEVLGRDETELVGRNWIELVVPLGVRDATREMFAATMEGTMEVMEYVESPVVRSGSSPGTTPCFATTPAPSSPRSARERTSPRGAATSRL